MGTDSRDGFDLGPLEAEVMRLVWDAGEVQVDEVHRTIQAARPIAYTTVMTVMSRLAARGFLQRHRSGRAYVYRPAVPREQLASSTLREWMQRYWGGRVGPAVSFLVGSQKLSAEDLAHLRQLVDRLSQEVGNQQ